MPAPSKLRPFPTHGGIATGSIDVAHHRTPGPRPGARERPEVGAPLRGGRDDGAEAGPAVHLGRGPPARVQGDPEWIVGERILVEVLAVAGAGVHFRENNCDGGMVCLNMYMCRACLVPWR